MKQEEWTVEAADAYLNEIPKFTSEKHTAEGLRRMLSYLNALPQEERIVHVAGTNGKGSVCSFLDAVLQKAGKRTARFTSPHLVRVTERFSFDGHCSWRHLRRLRHHMFILSRKDWGIRRILNICF